MITGLKKSQKMENQTFADDARNVAAKVGHQHYRRTGTLDKIDTIVEEDEEEGRKVLRREYSLRCNRVHSERD